MALQQERLVAYWATLARMWAASSVVLPLYSAHMWPLTTVPSFENTRTRIMSCSRMRAAEGHQDS